MGMTINRRYRDAIYDGLMTDLTAHGDIFMCLRNDETDDAKRLHHRFRGELRLLDDLGWEQEPEAERFELTMPPRELRPIIEPSNVSTGAPSLGSTTHRTSWPTTALPT